MQRVLPLLAALLTTALFAAGCGSSSSGSSSQGKDPASVAPRASVVYGTAVIRPTGSLKSDVEAAGRKVLAGKELGPAVQSLLDKAFRSSHLNYEQDVKPWLGKHAGFFLSSISPAAGAAIVETTDSGKASSAVEKSAKADHKTLSKQTYRGTDYTVESGDNSAFATVDGFLVVGTESGVKASIDASKGDALADADSFKTATDKVSKDGLALFYVDIPRVLDAVAQANPQAAVVLGQLRGLPQFQKLKPIAADITANGDAIRVEFPAHPSDGTTADAIAKLPADSWLAIAAPKAGDTIRRFITSISQLAGGDVLNIASRQLKAKTGLDLQHDILDWIGGVSIYATGTSLLDLNAAVVIGSRNPAASKRAVAKLSRLIIKAAKVPVTKVAGGIVLHPPKVPGPITFAAVGDKVVLAYGKNGVARALHPQGQLSGSASYKAAEAALGGGRPSFMLYAPSIIQLAQGLGAGKSAGFQKALPYLQAYTAIAFGTVESGGKTLGRLAVGLK